MAGLICDFRNRISHLQGMRAEIMPELVRGNPVRTLIEKSVHTAAVEFSTIPADKQILRLGVFLLLKYSRTALDDLVIDEYDSAAYCLFQSPAVPLPESQYLSGRC